jgi:hypothetical protein
MSEPENGGPAFPQNLPDDFVWRLPGNPGGMSLRDYFAGQAIIGLVGHGNNVEAEKYDPTATIADVVAGHAYFIADAMLKARQE